MGRLQFIARHREAHHTFHGYIAQPTRFVCALKKCPCVLVINTVVMSGPPKHTLVGRFAATGCVSNTRPLGENTYSIGPGPLTSQPAVATMLPSASKHMPSMPRCTPRESSPQVNSAS